VTRLGSALKKAKRIADEEGVKPKKCSVIGCEEREIELIELLPLDPIDHDETLVYLCDGHQEWADERNALAEAVADELREKRKEVGQEHFEEIQRLTIPQDDIDEDVLQGDVEDGQRLGLEEVINGVGE
jgi:hypothetical protein